MPSSLVFGSYRSIAAALAEEIRPRLRAGERTEIIVPTRSAADTLLTFLKDDLPTTRLEVHSIETLATRIVNEAGRYPRIASEHERTLSMELAARAIDSELASTPGMTSMLLRSERDVRDSGVGPADLRHRISAAARLTVRDRLTTIERIWSAAGQILRESGASTQSELLASATEMVRSGTHATPQIVFGFYDATGLQRGFLDALAESGNVASIWIPAPVEPKGVLPARLAYAGPFVEWARTTASNERILEPEAQTSDWTIAAYSSPLAEIHEVCRSVRALLDDGIAAADIAIVARAVDPREAALISTMARRFGFTLQGLPGRRLSGNRIARGIVDLLLLQDRGFLRRDVMEIIRSGARLPDVGGTLPSLDRLESATRKAQIARGRRDLILAAEKRARYRSDEPDDTVLRYADLVDALERRTNGFGAHRTGNAWSHSLEELLSLFHVETEEDLAAIDVVRDLARGLRRTGFASKRIDAKTIARLIEEGSPLPAPPPDEPSIWFGDVMRFRGLAVRHLFAIRMQHDSVPQRRIEDALLPDVDRRTLGVRQIGDGRDEEALLFSLMTSAAGTIHFSFAASDSIGRTLRPSPFVKDFAIEHRPNDRLDILQSLHSWLRAAPHPPSRARSLRERAIEARIDEGDPSLVRALQLVARKETSSSFDGRVRPGDALHQRLEKVFSRISPSRLEHLGECPQRFFITTVLGLREVEDPEPNVQIEIRQKGLIDHQILEELYSGLSDEDWKRIESGDEAALPASLRERLDTVVERKFRELDTEFPALNETIRLIERDETTEVLARFAAADLAELASSGLRPSDFELLLDVERDEGSRLRLGPIEAGIHGRIDRVDRHPDGGVRVIDYKAGKAFRQTRLETRIDEGLRLQLAIYALVVRRLWDLDPESISASIRPLRVDASESDTYAFRLAERYERLTAMLDTLANAIWSGRFPAVPYKDVCNYCIINAWCRTKNDPRSASRATRDGSAVRHLEADES